MVHQYSSAKDFLKASFQSSRAGNEALSLAQFAKRIGIGTSTLKMILTGKRNLTIHHVLSFSRAFRLSPNETSYLETLVLKENARNHWEENYYDRILKQKKKDIRISTITMADKELLTDILALPLLVELIESQSLEIDTKILAEKFNSSENQINRLILTLKKHKLIKKQDDGSFHIAFDKLNHRNLQKKYISNLLAEASKKVQTEYDSPTSLFVGYTFSTTDHSLIQLQMDLKALMEKYMAEDPLNPTERKIAQACIQIFPVSKTQKL